MITFNLDVVLSSMANGYYIYAILISSTILARLLIQRKMQSIKEAKCSFPFKGLMERKILTPVSWSNQMKSRALLQMQRYEAAKSEWGIIPFTFIDLGQWLPRAHSPFLQCWPVNLSPGLAKMGLNIDRSNSIIRKSC